MTQLSALTKVFLAGIVAISWLLPPASAAAVTTCEVRISETAASGAADIGGAGLEQQDAITVKNLNPTTSATVQLVYFQSNGIRSEATTLSLGTIAAGGTRTYVSPTLASLNPTATSLAGLSFAASGGTVLIQKTSGAVYCDELGWGNATLSEGQPVVAPRPGQTLARPDGADTNNNRADFAIWQPDCVAPQIREVQPFVTDSAGQAVDAWIELFGTADPIADCTLLTTTGDSYVIPAADLPAAGATVIVNRGLNAEGHATQLHLGESGSQLWFANASYTEPPTFYLPVATLTYPAIERTQTWSLTDGLWRASYAATPNAPNIYQAQPSAMAPTSSPCDSVRLTELLPNPAGDDGGQEWIELHNTTDAVVMLGDCQITVGTTTYNFADYEGLLAGEYRAFSEVSDANGASKSITLPNTSDSNLRVTLSWLATDGAVVVVQSFDLYDGATNTAAPEDQTWAKFTDGWRWSVVPTPGMENIDQISGDPAAPTDGPSPTPSDDGVASPSPQTDALVITELLPNPAAPQTDDVDEYVELYNQSADPINLTGFTLQTGMNFSYSYTFPQRTIEPGSYITITSGQSALSLSNTSGQARLLDPTGQVVSQTDAYANAPEGVAWSLVDGTWHWTGTPTAGSANSYAPTITGAASTSAKTTPKTTATKAATTKTTAVKSAKTTAPKATTKAAAKTTTASPNGAAVANKPAPLHIAILAAIGGAGVLYAAYEYRTDIANRFRQLRRNRIDWGSMWRGATGR